MNNIGNYSADLIVANLLYAQPNNEKHLRYACDLYDENQQRDAIIALPGEILYKIFSMLTLTSLNSINLVSRRWHVIENDRLITIAFLACIEGRQIFIDIFAEFKTYFNLFFPSNLEQLSKFLKDRDNAVLVTILLRVFMEVHQSQNKTSDILKVLNLYKEDDCSKLPLFLCLFNHLILKKSCNERLGAPDANERRILFKNFRKIRVYAERANQTDSTGFASYVTALVFNYIDRDIFNDKDEAILKFLTISSKKGFPEAFWQLGDLYYIKKSNPSDEDKLKAYKYYKEGADLKCPTAYQRLHFMSYNNDNSLSKESALNYLSLAAEAGNKEALYNLGALYLDELCGFEKNIEKGLKYLEKAAYHNHISALCYLCFHYALGFYTTKNNEKVKIFVNILKNYLSSGKSISQEDYRNIGLLYECGYGVEKDLNIAKNYYEASAKVGNKLSSFILGTFIEERDFAFDADKMIKYYKEAADKEHLTSQFKMCQIYSRGSYGIPQDFEKAFHYFKLLNVEKQDPAFEVVRLEIIGNCYMHGYGVQIDLELAYEYFHKAAEQNHASAQFKLCSYYYLKNDLEKSQFYFKLLSDPNHPQTIMHLNKRYHHINYCYTHGIGTVKDEKQAAHYKQLEQDTGIRFLTKTWI